MTLDERFQGCLVGLAAGDAVGTTVEFKARDSFRPMTDMVGGGPFRLRPGQWTDDMSMALCIANSLLETRRFDAADQMDKYGKWYQHGYMSSNGSCFDIGNTCHAAIVAYWKTGNPFSGSTDPYSAGNGCIMRLAPIPMYFFSSLDEVEHYSAECSRTTHGAQECVDASRLFGRMLWRALSGQSKDDILAGDVGTFKGAPNLVDIANLAYANHSRQQIQGNGYVVRSLEAALWCFFKTDSFRDAILLAANLGEDADTTAAICGQIAGAYYGIEGIPPRWVGKLTMRDRIIEIASTMAARHQ